MRLRQIRLRTFFVLLTLLVVFTGSHIRAVSIQRRAVLAIREANGEVGYYSRFLPMHWLPASLLQILGKDFFFSVGNVHFTQTGISDDDLCKILDNLPRINMLRLTSTNVTDASLECVSKLTKLQHLTLTSCKAIGDKGMVFLSSLKNLEFINVSDTEVADQGAIALSKLPRLRSLFASGTKISDVGVSAWEGSTILEDLSLQYCPVNDASLVSISKIPNLKYLVLSGTNVSDNGIEYLSSLKDLKTLYLMYTSVTQDGIKKLGETAKQVDVISGSP